nr:hypothetical protein [Tanacetum cinerariifolium]
MESAYSFGICVSRQNEVADVSLDFPVNLEPSSSLRATDVTLTRAIDRSVMFGCTYITWTELKMASISEEFIYADKICLRNFSCVKQLLAGNA